MAFQGDEACATGCENGTCHASWGVNSTDVTSQRELETTPWKNNQPLQNAGVTSEQCGDPGGCSCGDFGQGPGGR